MKKGLSTKMNTPHSQQLPSIPIQYSSSCSSSQVVDPLSSSPPYTQQMSDLPMIHMETIKEEIVITSMETTERPSSYSISSFIQLPMMRALSGSSVTSPVVHFRSVLSGLLFDYFIEFNNKGTITIKFFPISFNQEPICIQLSSVSIFSEVFENERTYQTTLDQHFFNSDYYMDSYKCIQVKIYQSQSKKPVKSIGLTNEQNCCYLNCMMQLLNRIPLVKELIVKTDSSLPHINLFQTMLSKIDDKSVVNLLDYYQKLGVNTSQQEDFPEIMTKVITLLVDTIPSLRTLFEGAYQWKQFRENDCDPIINEESFFFLLVPLNKDSKLELLIEQLLYPEKVESNDSIVVRQASFKSLPSILMVQLMRFSTDVKNNCSVSFPLHLDLTAYTNDDNHYTLFGVLIHSGDCKQGHYKIELYNFENKNWLLYDDEQVSIIPSAEVFDDNYGGTYNCIFYQNGLNSQLQNRVSNAYVLFYVRDSEINQLFIRQSSVCQTIRILSKLIPSEDFFICTFKMILNDVSDYMKHEESIRISIDISKSVTALNIWQLLEEQNPGLITSLNPMNTKFVLLNSFGLVTEVVHCMDNTIDLQSYIIQWKKTGMRTIYLYVIASSVWNVSLQQICSTFQVSLPFMMSSALLSSNLVKYSRLLLVQNSIEELKTIVSLHQLKFREISHYDLKHDIGTYYRILFQR